MLPNTSRRWTRSRRLVSMAMQASRTAAGSPKRCTASSRAAASVQPAATRSRTRISKWNRISSSTSSRTLERQKRTCLRQFT
jgi:hypothetical protein